MKANEKEKIIFRMIDDLDKLRNLDEKEKFQSYTKVRMALISIYLEDKQVTVQIGKKKVTGK